MPRYDETSTCFVCGFCIQTEDLILDLESIDTISFDEHSFRLTSFRFFLEHFENGIQTEDECECSLGCRAMFRDILICFPLFCNVASFPR